MVYEKTNQFLEKNARIIKKVAICLILFMFLRSGINKFNKFDKSQQMLASKPMGIKNEQMRKFLMGLVVIIEVFAPLIIVAHMFMKNPPKILKMLKLFSIISLILFTIIATLIYHPPQKNMISFTTHLAIVGGLMLML